MSSSRPPLPGVRRAELRGLELDHCLARGLLFGCGVDRFQRGGNLSVRDAYLLRLQQESTTITQRLGLWTVLQAGSVMLILLGAAALTLITTG